MPKKRKTIKKVAPKKVAPKKAAPKKAAPKKVAPKPEEPKPEVPLFLVAPPVDILGAHPPSEQRPYVLRTRKGVFIHALEDFIEARVLARSFTGSIKVMRYAKGKPEVCLSFSGQW